MRQKHGSFAVTRLSQAALKIRFAYIEETRSWGTANADNHSSQQFFSLLLFLTVSIIPKKKAVSVASKSKFNLIFVAILSNQSLTLVACQSHGCLMFVAS